MNIIGQRRKLCGLLQRRCAYVGGYNSICAALLKQRNRKPAVVAAYVGSQMGTRVMKVDKFYPSSQLCHGCGYQNKDVKDVSVYEWTCPNCGEHHDRDRNAARNILSEGLRILSV